MGTIIQGPWQSRSPKDEEQTRRADTGSDLIDIETWADLFLFEPEPTPEPKPSFVGSPVVDQLFAAIKKHNERP
jgi:hypothetical protein